MLINSSNKAKPMYPQPSVFGFLFEKQARRNDVIYNRLISFNLVKRLA